MLNELLFFFQIVIAELFGHVEIYVSMRPAIYLRIVSLSLPDGGWLVIIEPNHLPVARLKCRIYT